jgi:primosomal protein N' (replication factor Y)
MPPFGRLAGVILSSADARAVDDAASALNRTAPRGQGIEILGPAQAPLAVLRGRHRRRFLVKADRTVNLQRRLADWISRTRVPDRVKVQLDIDPYSFL